MSALNSHYIYIFDQQLRNLSVNSHFLSIEPIYQIIYGSAFWLRNAVKITTHYLKLVVLICRIPTKFYGNSQIFASDAFS